MDYPINIKKRFKLDRELTLNHEDIINIINEKELTVNDLNINIYIIKDAMQVDEISVNISNC